jgi:hypothetical protein
MLRRIDSGRVLRDSLNVLGPNIVQGADSRLAPEAAGAWDECTRRGSREL